MAAKLTLRRLRSSPLASELVREVSWHPQKMMQPCFFVDGLKSREPIVGLPGVFRESLDSLLRQTESDLEAGVSKFLLFGVPSQKKESGFNAEATARAIRALKQRFGNDLLLGVDVCVCSYTTHGQCGVLNDAGDHVLNEQTVAELAQLARAYVDAGADLVAPSDMMDGRVAAIREALDAAGHDRTLIMSYSAKFHSRFYGPFRLAADSAPKPGAKASSLKDRASYQIDPANPRDAMRSSQRDADEGADILMVKPGLPYLDQLAKLSAEIPLPWAVYEVSGEYAAIELLAREGLIDADRAHAEAWTSFARAGASIIITYGARRAHAIFTGVENVKKESK